MYLYQTIQQSTALEFEVESCISQRLVMIHFTSQKDFSVSLNPLIGSLIWV